MERDKIIILKERGLISITGEDCGEFLQNIITNDVNKVSRSQTIFSGIFTPQGKYLFEFFLIKFEKGFYIDCDGKMTKNIINFLEKYKLNSRVEIYDKSNEFVTGIISYDKFEEIKKIQVEDNQTVWFRDGPCFTDPRLKKLGVRILSSLEKLYLTIKKLSLKIQEEDLYFNNAFKHGVPIIGVNKLQEKLFGLEANFEKYSAIDFKKGCYIGQENTARMKIRNKISKQLVPVVTDSLLSEGDELVCENKKIGKILIGEKYPFALVKIEQIKFVDLQKKDITINQKKIKLIQV